VLAAGAAPQTVTDSGTTNTIPVLTGTSTVGNSPIAVSGSNVWMGLTFRISDRDGVLAGRKQTTGTEEQRPESHCSNCVQFVPPAESYFGDPPF
jgi:hypothetical protein